jgi:DHA2 family multidrug resistance protein
MNATLSASPVPDTGRLAYKWKVLISVVFGIFMVILDTTVVNVAFRTLQQELGVSLNDSQWIISVYVLALGICTPLAGFLGDRFGIKRMFVGGLAIFVAGSFLCGIAPNLWLLVLARALQGAGGGVALPLGTALLFRTFPPHEQGTALGIFGIALVVAPALGPILGGWLVDQGHWRWIFFINVPVGVLGVFLGARWLRELPSARKPRLDGAGLVTSVVGFGAVLYAASISADLGWSSPTVLLWFLFGAAVLSFYALTQLYTAPDPLLNLRLFHKPVFLTASLVGYVSVVALFGAEFLMPLYLQALRGYTALQTGFILLPLAIAAGITMPIAGRLYDRVGARPLVTIGFIVLAVNTWQLSRLEANTPIAWIAFLLLLRGLALGLTVQTTFVTALSVVPIREIAGGSALTNSTRQVAQALAVAVLATVLTSTLSPEIKAVSAQLRESGVAAHSSATVALCDPSTYPTVPSATAAGASPSLASAAAQGVPPAGRATAALGATLLRACQEQVAGFEKTYLLTFFASLVALALGLTLPGWPGPYHGRRSADGHHGPPMAGGH